MKTVSFRDINQNEPQSYTNLLNGIICVDMLVLDTELIHCNHMLKKKNISPKYEFLHQKGTPYMLY